MRTTISILLTLLLAGCATLRSVDGYSLDEDAWKTNERDIRSRASFELSCPAESLTLQVLTLWAYSDKYAGQVGVTGCGKKTIYVRGGTAGWVANVSSGEQGQEKQKE